MEAAEALRKLETGPEGLTEAVAEERLAKAGPTKFPARNAITGPPASSTPCAIRWSFC